MKQKSKSEKELLSIFETLSEIEQSIVCLLSVIYDYATRSSLATCLLRIGVRDERGSAFKLTTLDPILEKLDKTKIIEFSDNGIQINHNFLAKATQICIKDGIFETLSEVVQKVIGLKEAWGGKEFRSYSQAIRDIRIAILTKNFQDAKNCLQKCFEQYYVYYSEESPYEIIFNRPFDITFFQTLPVEIYSEALINIFKNSMLLTLKPEKKPFSFLLSLRDLNQENSIPENLQNILAEQLIFRGRFNEALKLVQNKNTIDAFILQGWIEFLLNNNKKALDYFQSALALKKKGTKKRTFYLSQIGGIFYILALLKNKNSALLQQAGNYISKLLKDKNYFYIDIYELFQQLIMVLNKIDISHSFSNFSQTDNNDSLFQYLLALVSYWIDQSKSKAYLKKLKESYNRALSCEYDWFAAEIAELIATIDNTEYVYKKFAEDFHKTNKTQGLINAVKIPEPWERSLNALIKLTDAKKEQKSITSGSRLAWFISSEYSFSMHPKEQTINAKGEWTKGKPIALKRLSEETDSFAFLSEQDRRICRCIYSEYESSGYGYYKNLCYYMNSEKAFPVLIGHPFVFWENSPNTPIEIVKKSPELLIQENVHHFTIQLYPKIQVSRPMELIKESSSRLVIYELTEEHKKIADILKGILKIPKGNKDLLLKAASNLSSSVTIHSDLGDDTSEAINADSLIHVHLFPAGNGLKIEILIRPFGSHGPFFHPGFGGKSVISELDGKRTISSRNLSLEKQKAFELIQACPALKEFSESEDGIYIFTIPEAESCLEFLEELKQIQNTVVIAWPEGESFRIRANVVPNQLKMSIQRENNWFKTSGELKVDDELSLKMETLLELIEESPGRFIPVGDKEFIALTERFRKKLEDFYSYLERKGKNFRFHNLAIPATLEFINEIESLDADQYWIDQQKKFKELPKIIPSIPSTLQTELRNYQTDGFNWLFRLAHWGVGACLADDMGLGKTIQALALILTQCQLGPTLIVAPSSVCINWLEETERFAPTLNAIAFGEFGAKDRQKNIENLSSFDMLICSYGLMQQELEMLSQVQWKIIVLDEAQAIKNPSSKRSHAAMKLKGDFKLITTGTPIENHLGELWNLFRFLNPGLLGSLEWFNQKFAFPIEKERNKNAQARLKRLIKPFILRRTKSEILEELPPKTEISLHVNMSYEEIAFYEAIRKKAEKKLSKPTEKDGKKYFQILAEIMRLRRACCHPRLVIPDINISNSKLTVFGDLLDDLIKNKHKALVFSQFVDYLKIICDFVEKRKISYQYLDGSTPMKERKKRIHSFQSGEGDLFIISLKAGGMGLNLTAADYVIHMDPWWNPAVEDQASDRAHRIGQERPVTIYRMVTTGTIEEKILKLHARKRDLADSLLEGSDISGKISTSELLKLIKEGDN